MFLTLYLLYNAPPTAFSSNQNYDKYSNNFNLLLNNGFNIINDKEKKNYFKKQFVDNQITCKKNLNNTTVNKYSEFSNKYKNDPFSIQSYYKL